MDLNGSPNCFSQSFLEILRKENIQDYVSNACGIFEKIEIDNCLFPLSIHKPTPFLNQSYVTSPQTTYGKYALSELNTIPFKPARLPLAALIRAMDALLGSSNIDQVVSFNNWLLSTNLYPPWLPSNLAHMTEKLIDLHPSSFLIARSLNCNHHSHLIECFQKAGWKLMPARQVWLMEPGQPHKKGRKNDSKLLAKSPLVRVVADDFTSEDFKRAKLLYDQLYLEKYSSLNPAFTEAFLRTGHKENMIHLEGLKDHQGILLGIVGTINFNGIITTPIVGYDLQQPQKLGLYRLLMAIAMEQMDETNSAYNVSSGAGYFKKLRGAFPEIEWTAYYDKHLPRTRTIPLSLLRSLLTHIGQPIMKKYEL